MLEMIDGGTFILDKTTQLTAGDFAAKYPDRLDEISQAVVAWYRWRVNELEQIQVNAGKSVEQMRASNAAVIQQQTALIAKLRSDYAALLESHKALAAEHSKLLAEVADLKSQLTAK